MGDLIFAEVLQGFRSDTEFNYRIDSALNGAEGLRKVQALQPDLVLLHSSPGKGFGAMRIPHQPGSLPPNRRVKTSTSRGSK